MIEINKKNILLGICVLVGVMIVVGVSGIGVWEYTNSDSFCTYVCHSVHPENTYSHRTSRHARVTCTECHMGRISTFKAMALKSTHSAHAWSMLVGYDRPLSSPSMKSSKDSCENCHSMQPHQYNSIRTYTTYATDEVSTETRTHLVMHNAGGIYRRDVGTGVQWHTENQVRFIATDPQNQTIPWVEVTRADGETTVYVDTKDPLPESEIARSKKHVMDCLDCHNRIGHPFPNPEVEVDKALTAGNLDRTFPYVKARVVDLFRQDVSTEEEAMRVVEEAWANYEKEFPDVAKKYPEAFERSEKFMKERQLLVLDMLVRSRFKDVGVSWMSFPDNLGHKNFRGCFRCHDGKHLNEQGEPVRLHCTLCHNAPAVVSEGEPPPRFMNPFSFRKPSDHNDARFMERHKKQSNVSCNVCHGRMVHGKDNGTFCSNRACHGRDWPGL